MRRSPAVDSDLFGAPIIRRPWDVSGMTIPGPRPPVQWAQTAAAADWTVVIVTGARDWSAYHVIADALREFDASRTLLLHGACRGADLIAAEVAWDYEMQIIPLPYVSGMGRAGGPYRNEREIIIASALRDVHWNSAVLAFHDKLRTGSAGTLDTVKRALAARHPVTRYNSGGDRKNIRTLTELMGEP